jgi:hypothetical protein
MAAGVYAEEHGSEEEGYGAGGAEALRKVHLRLYVSRAAALVRDRLVVPYLESAVFDLSSAG